MEKSALGPSVIPSYRRVVGLASESKLPVELARRSACVGSSNWLTGLGDGKVANPGEKGEKGISGSRGVVASETDLRRFSVPVRSCNDIPRISNRSFWACIIAREAVDGVERNRDVAAVEFVRSLDERRFSVLRFVGTSGTGGTSSEAVENKLIPGDWGNRTLAYRKLPADKRAALRCDIDIRKLALEALTLVLRAADTRLDLLLDWTDSDFIEDADALAVEASEYLCLKSSSSRSTTSAVAQASSRSASSVASWMVKSQTSAVERMKLVFNLRSAMAKALPEW